MSGLALVFEAQTLDGDCEQWTAIPTKSVCASCGLLCASSHSGEPEPKTFVMSPLALVDVFSSSMFAVPTPPTSQPLRVNGTHGAGVVFWPSEIMFGQRVEGGVDLVGPVLERSSRSRPSRPA